MLAEHLVHSHHRLSLHNSLAVSMKRALALANAFCYFLLASRTAADVGNAAFMMFMRWICELSPIGRRVVNKLSIVSKSALAGRNQLSRLPFYHRFFCRSEIDRCTYPSDGRCSPCVRIDARRQNEGDKTKTNVL